MMGFGIEVFYSPGVRTILVGNNHYPVDVSLMTITLWWCKQVRSQGLGSLESAKGVR